MFELLRLFLFPCLAAAGWMASTRHPEAARRMARGGAMLLAALLGFCCLSGVWHSSETVGEIHRWSGHALVIAAWLATPLAIGVLVQRRLRRRPVSVIALSLGLLLLLAVVLFASFTGYLGPSHDLEPLPETRNRFIVLHFFALPILTAAFVTVWLWCFRPAADA